MAYYENLPVYKKTMELAVFFENVVRNFSRYNKYAIGAELRDLSRRLFTLVIRANSRRDKISALSEFLIFELRVLMDEQGLKERTEQFALRKTAHGGRTD